MYCECQGHSELQTKMEVLEDQEDQEDQECFISSIEQYSRRSSIEIQGIPKTVKDEELESKVIDVFSGLNISISSKDVEDCHRPGKDDKNTIVRFVNTRQ